MPDTVRSALDRALVALDRLEELGQDVDDEWSYVTDLAEAWRTRIRDVAADHGDATLEDGRAAAIDRAIAETRLIADPHRAIDWLSTFPQVVLVALGERP